MKKSIAVLLALALCAAFAFAETGSGNLQKVYPIDSDVYKAIRLLYIDVGYSLPSTGGPWSADELTKMLARIDRASLSGGALAAYDYAASQLKEGTKAVKFGLAAAVEGYYHTDTANFTHEQDWTRGFDERAPVLDIMLETWPSEHFYGFSSLSVRNNEFNGWDARGTTSTFFGSSALTTNLPLVPPAVMNDLDFNIPFRAFGAVGGDGWSFQAGREKLSWGPGETGNFILGDQILYHNMARLAAYGKNFKYTLLTSFFPHPQNYYTEAQGIMDGSGNITNSQWQADPVSGINMFLGHRLEWRLFKDKVGLAITEAIMYQSKDNYLDLTILSPTAIFHNYYIRGNANSIITAELDYTPIRHLNLYGQVVVDEFALPGEPVPGVNDGALPNGYGFMAGAKGSYPLGGGMLFGSVEWAKTDPYLYLRDDGDYTQSLGEYGINWIVAIRQFSNGSGVSYTEDFLGYRYGGDAIVMNANLGYTRFGKFNVMGHFFYMVHGTHDKWTLWTRVDASPSSSTPNVSTPTTEHNSGNNGDLTAQATRDSASQTTVVGIKGVYTLLKGLDLYGQCDYVHIVNPGNISSNPAISDVQLTAGVSYKL